MQIISTRRLRDFWRVHAGAENPLRAWAKIVSHASWETPQNVKHRFGTAVDILGDNRVVFDIGGNKYRLIVHVSYRRKLVLVKFIGTHADYDRINAETVGR